MHLLEDIHFLEDMSLLESLYAQHQEPRVPLHLFCSPGLRRAA